MQLNPETAEIFVRTATEAIRAGASEDLDTALAALPAPIYITDPSGVLTYFNNACVVFAGRVPIVGQDRWCITWRLQTHDGKALQHDDCPMAHAIRQKRPIRGVVAIAVRPDGERRTFSPFPTPVSDENGAPLGAVNVFLDLTRERRILDLRRKSRQYREWAAAAKDARMANALKCTAVEYESEAQALEHLNKADDQNRV